ncbi:MAG: GxxExxY protein [bacterium]|nr:GxxExxY protein [bacterium]
MNTLKNAKEKKKKNIVDLLYKDLSYVIQGIAFEIRKDFGLGHKEQIYQKAFEEELKRHEVPYEREKSIKIYSPRDGKFIGLYRPDFIIDNKVILEIKTLQFVPRAEIRKIYDYLRNSEYELGYLINFASPKLYIKRVIFTNNKKSLFKNLLVSFSLFLVLISGLLFTGLTVNAAQLNLVSQTQEIRLDDQFEVGLFLNTENEDINALEGKIIFPANLLELKEIRDGNSIVNFWIEKPSISRTVTNTKTNSNELVFSGIIPGGYNEEKGIILSLVFRAKEEGEGNVEMQNLRALLNDGKGTETKSSFLPFHFKIFPPLPGLIVQPPPFADNIPPENFTAVVSQDENIFEGKWFVVFATQDKGFGLLRYEVAEERAELMRNKTPNYAKMRWVEAESPYLLKDQKLKSWIYAKAVDKAGNARIAVVEPRYPMRWYEQPLVWGIIIVIGVVVFVLGSVKRKAKNAK